MTFVGMLHHLFIPHETNNHRAKILHIDAMLFYVLLFTVFNVSIRSAHRQIPDVLGYATDIHVEQLLTDTNALRQSLGLTPLILNPKLSQAAAAKAQDMFAKNYWAHNSPTGNTPWDFILDAGYKYTVAGENLAKNFTDSQSVVNAWLASPTHKDNMVKPSYREIGFAVVNGKLNGEETTLVVQMFGASVQATPIVEAPKPPQLVEKALAVEDIPLVATAPPTTTAVEAAPQDIVNTQFLGVTKTPTINIPTMTRNMVYLFAGVLMLVLLLDAWIVSRQRIVRVAGHNIAHFLFLSSVMIAAGSISRGVLL